MTEGLLPDVVAPGSRLVQLPQAGIHKLRYGEARIVVELGRAVVVWFGLLVIYGSQHRVTQQAIVGITFATLVWLLTLRSAAASARLVLGPTLTASVGTALGFAIVAASSTSVVGLQASYSLLGASALGVFCSTVVWDWFVDKTAASKRRVLLVGSDGVDLVARERGACRRAGFDIVGTVPDAQELEEIVSVQRPDIVVLTDEATYENALDRLMDARANVRVSGFASFCEYALGCVPVERISSAWFMSLFHPRQHVYTRFAKRVFDVVVALVALALAAPVLVALALLTRMTAGFVIYRQVRVGEGGRHFTIYKFTTMGCDAEHDGAAFSCPDDRRATGIGSVLRRTHLDELPQLWNVLKGDMSIVGPRPERPEFIEMLDAAVPFWSRRLLVKPGITGWAQVRCGYASDSKGMESKLSYDLWYLRHRSLLLDLAVCMRTLFALAARPGRS